MALPHKAFPITDQVQGLRLDFQLTAVTLKLEHNELTSSASHHQGLAEGAQAELLDAQAWVIAVRVKGPNLPEWRPLFIINIVMGAKIKAKDVGSAQAVHELH
jgi:hypothetical protein